jgi:hypothetical protein
MVHDGTSVVTSQLATLCEGTHYYLHSKGSEVRRFLQFYLMPSHITSFTVAGLLILSTSTTHTTACFLRYVGFSDEVTFAKVKTFVVTIQVFIVEL